MLLIITGPSIRVEPGPDDLIRSGGVLLHHCRSQVCVSVEHLSESKSRTQKNNVFLLEHSTDDIMLLPVLRFSLCLLLFSSNTFLNQSTSIYTRSDCSNDFMQIWSGLVFCRSVWDEVKPFDLCCTDALRLNAMHIFTSLYLHKLECWSFLKSFLNLAQKAKALILAKSICQQHIIPKTNV